MDGNEFKSRFLPYTNLIYKISFAITKDREDAEDVVQEVYEKLWKSRQSLSEVENDKCIVHYNFISGSLKSLLDIRMIYLLTLYQLTHQENVPR
jgi:hypothetical protein